MLDDYQPRMVTIECGIYDIEDGVALADYLENLARARAVGAGSNLSEV
jgi:hypothetical protein